MAYINGIKTVGDPNHWTKSWDDILQVRKVPTQPGGMIFCLTSSRKRLQKWWLTGGLPKIVKWTLMAFCRAQCPHDLILLSELMRFFFSEPKNKATCSIWRHFPQQRFEKQKLSLCFKLLIRYHWGRLHNSWEVSQCFAADCAVASESGGCSLYMSPRDCGDCRSIIAIGY